MLTFFFINVNLSKSSQDDVSLLRLVVRTSGFHPDNRRSIRLGDVKACLKKQAFFLHSEGIMTPENERVKGLNEACLDRTYFHKKILSYVVES